MRGRTTPSTTVRDALYVIVFEAETPAGLAYDVALLVLILGSVVSTMLETVHSIYTHNQATFAITERVFTGTFAADYILRAAVAKPNARAYCCSFFGAVDLCSILPTLLEELTSMHTQFRIVRVLRLLRVLRVLHFAGFSAEAEAPLENVIEHGDEEHEEAFQTFEQWFFWSWSASQLYILNGIL